MIVWVVMVVNGGGDGYGHGGDGAGGDGGGNEAQYNAWFPRVLGLPQTIFDPGKRYLKSCPAQGSIKRLSKFLQMQH